MLCGLILNKVIFAPKNITMHITSSMRMADVIQANIKLLAIIQRLNIPLGFRDKTVYEVCKQNKVDSEFFIQLASAFGSKDKLKSENFDPFPVDWIIDYLRNAHHCYINHRIPEIERQILNFEKVVDVNDENIQLLLNFFRDYIKEFTKHIEKEERFVFPFIQRLDEQLKSNGNDDKHSIGNDSIGTYHDDHTHIEETLFDLKSLLLKYLPPPSNSCLYNNLVFDIFRLEADLLDHAELEEKVLFPRVRQMEQELIKRKEL